jgi:serine/threonine protein kinase
MKKAFVVGIDNYKKKPLEACVKDAEEVAQLLLEPDYYDFKVELCTNEQASLQAIRQGINRLLEGDPELALFYFSGHGIVTDLGGYIVSQDYTELEDPGLSLDLLNKLIQARAKPTTSFILILDCCHAGMAKLRGLNGDTESDMNLLTKEVVTQSIKSSQGRVVLAACKPNEQAVELSKEGHGIFTLHLLNGLLGEAANQDGNITPTSIYEYISSIFENINLQTPVLSGDISGRIVIGKGFPAVKGDMSVNELNRIEQKAHSLLDEYLADTSKNITDEEWRNSGFKNACAQLGVIIDWQKDKIAEHKALRTHKEFKRALQRSNAELSRLGSLYSGVRTQKGIIVDKLGSGTFGTVWKVQGINNEIVAYKAYHSQELELEDKLTRFKRGYQAMKRLDHPQVVKVWDYVDVPIGFYMEYIDGPNLRDFSGIEQSLQELLHHMLDIVDTLRHAHNKGVVHRDVKPENILMKYEKESGQWIPFLTDFDLAWFSAASQVTKVGIGAFAYAAPEQFTQPGAAISHARTTDIYAFGQLAYFILTKSDPIPSGLSQNQVALSHHLKDWPSGKAAERFLNLYVKCSQAKPSERFRDFEQIWEEMHEILRLLSESGTEKVLTVEEFLFQVKFEILGLSEQENRNNIASYFSKSQHTSIVVETKGTGKKNHVNLVFQLSFQDKLAFVDLTHEKARIVISRRIDDALIPFPEASRASSHSGFSGQYDTSIRISEVLLNYSSAIRVSQIIKRLIEILEKN